MYLVRTDKNGTEYYQSFCGKCGGSGVYLHFGTCFDCDGSGKIFRKEYTTKHRAKLDAQNERARKRRAELREYKRVEGLRIWRERNPEKAKAYDDRQKRIKEAKRLEALEQESQEYLGMVGDRSEFEVTVENIFHFENTWGTTRIHIMKDQEKNMLVWKTQSRLVDDDGEDIEVGKSIILIGTINDHAEYKGNKQTILNRVKVIERMS